MVYSNETILAVGTPGWKLTLTTTTPSINPNFQDNLQFAGKLTDANNIPLAGQRIDLNIRWFKNGSPVLSFLNGLWTQYSGNDPSNFAFGPAITAADGTYTISLGLGDFVHSGYGWVSTLQVYGGNNFDAIHFITSSGENAPPPPSVMFANPSIGVASPLDPFLAWGVAIGALGVAYWKLRKDKTKVEEDYW